MERALTIVKDELYHIVNGTKVLGAPSGLYGNISIGLYGNISGLYGNIDDCKITDEEREKGINIKDLIK